MRTKFIITIVSLSLIVLIAGCSSKQTANSNTVNPATNTNANPTTTTTDANTNTTAQNPTTQQSPINSQDPTQNMEVKPNPPRPGPDNSEITVVMNPKDGSVTETRVFKSHSTVSKLIRLTDSKLQKSARVYDKQGNVKDLPQDKFESAMQMMGDDLAKAVGFALPKTKEVVNESKEKMKNQEEGVVDKGKQIGGEVVDKTKDGAKTVAEKTKQGAKTIGNKVKGKVKP